MIAMAAAMRTLMATGFMVWLLGKQVWVLRAVEGGNGRQITEPWDGGRIHAPMVAHPLPTSLASAARAAMAAAVSILMTVGFMAWLLGKWVCVLQVVEGE